MRRTTSLGLQECQDTPQVLSSSEEPLNSTSLQTDSNVNSPVENSMPFSHLGCGYDDQEMVGSMSARVFVLDVEGKPLTPCKNSKARKLLKSKQAKPIWNKFGRFGLQMLVETRRAVPKSVLGCDFGTKFEGYSLLSGKENLLNVMWKLPDKKKLVRKLTERRQLRRARRFRNCRRRECKSERCRKGFIAPSQLQIVNSRLKCIQEFFRYYPIDTVAMEDVKAKSSKKWKGNFSTIEIGKNKIYDWIKQRAYLQLFFGSNTESCRENYDYKKSSSKSAEVFNSHCSDALAIATDIYAKQHIEQGEFIIVDDTYRCVRRKLHDSNFSKGHIRYLYSTGNFKRIRKGTICELGQICGGLQQNYIRKNNNVSLYNYIYVYNWDGKRIEKSFKKIEWLSHKFKTNKGLDE